MMLTAMTVSAMADPTITADPPGPDFCASESAGSVKVIFNSGTIAPPTASCCKSGTTGTWSQTGTSYQWTGKVSNPTNSGTATLDTTGTNGAISATCLATYTWTCSVTSGTTTTTDTATGNYNLKCPKETITMDNAQCGLEYGAYAISQASG